MTDTTPDAGHEGVELPDALVRKAYEHFLHDAEFPCSASAMGEAIRIALAVLAPSPDPVAPLSQAAKDVVTERRRQVEVEGWTAEKDDAHNKGEMAAAAANYVALACMGSSLGGSEWDRSVAPPLTGLGYSAGWESRLQNVLNWPWLRQWWKPGSVRRMLVKAAALILAEIERLDRLAAKDHAHDQ